MRERLFRKDKSIEKTVKDILKSRAQTRIYVYLLRKNGAKTEEIIKGTRLHPSTVRETLSKMHEEKLIIREKQKNDHIGKNPYIYHPIPPIELLKRYTDEMEDRLNTLANIYSSKNNRKKNRIVRIRIIERAEEI